MILVETKNVQQYDRRPSRSKIIERLGVDIRTEVFVKDYDGNILQLSNGEFIRTRTVIWVAGVTGNTVDGLSQEVVTRGNRIKVDRYNKVQGYQNIFAIGDLACMSTPKYPNGHPQVANVAINQAKLLAKNLKLLISGKQPKEYEYKDLGSMATIGRNKAVVDLPFIHFKGYFAWVIWMFLHLMLILSVRNKLIIFINWAWAYVKKDTSLRLILKEDKKKCTHLK